MLREVGERIRKMRCGVGLGNREEASRELGISWHSLQRFEKGRQVPNWTNLSSILEGFEASDSERAWILFRLSGCSKAHADRVARALR